MGAPPMIFFLREWAGKKTKTIGAQYEPHPNFVLYPFFFKNVRWVQQIVNKYKNKKKSMDKLPMIFF